MKRFLFFLLINEYFESLHNVDPRSEFTDINNVNDDGN